jgi:hypothetical protein
VDVKMLDVNKEEFWINGTYKFECIIVLIASMLETYMFRAVKLDVNTLDVNKEELWIKGTYKLDCTILLTADKLIVDILFAARVEIRHVDILASFKSEVEACRVIRFPAVVASGKAWVLITAHNVGVFGDTVMNP